MRFSSLERVWPTEQIVIKWPGLVALLPREMIKVARHVKAMHSYKGPPPPRSERTLECVCVCRESEISAWESALLGHLGARL